MKKALAILAAMTAIGFTLPAEAEANHRRIVSYTSCGRPVYSVYQIMGYDRCGNPVGRWVTQSAHCGCNSCNPRHRHHNHHAHSGFRNNGGYNSGVCNPGHGHRGSSGGFYFRFGR